MYVDDLLKYGNHPTHLMVFSQSRHSMTVTYHMENPGSIEFPYDTIYVPKYPPLESGYGFSREPDDNCGWRLTPDRQLLLASLCTLPFEGSNSGQLQGRVLPGMVHL